MGTIQCSGLETQQIPVTDRLVILIDHGAGKILICIYADRASLGSLCIISLDLRRQERLDKTPAGISFRCLRRYGYRAAHRKQRSSAVYRRNTEDRRFTCVVTDTCQIHIKRNRIQIYGTVIDKMIAVAQIYYIRFLGPNDDRGKHIFVGIGSQCPERIVVVIHIPVSGNELITHCIHAGNEELGLVHSQRILAVTYRTYERSILIKGKTRLPRLDILIQNGYTRYTERERYLVEPVFRLCRFYNI